MTREEIENYEPEKIQTMDDFVAFCGYHDSDFVYEWKEYGYKNNKRIDYDKPRLEMWVPFDKLDILTSQVLGNAYFEDGRYPEINLYDGGVYIGPDEVEEMLEWLEIEKPEEVFPFDVVCCSYPDLSTPEKVDAYFEKLKKLRADVNPADSADSDTSNAPATDAQ